MIWDDDDKDQWFQLVGLYHDLSDAPKLAANSRWQKNRSLGDRPVTAMAKALGIYDIGINPVSTNL